MPILIREHRADRLARELVETLWEDSIDDDGNRPSIYSIFDLDINALYEAASNNFFDGCNTPLIHEACCDISSQVRTLKEDKDWLKSVTFKVAQTEGYRKSFS